MGRTTGTILFALVIACRTVLPVLATERIAKQEQAKCAVCHEKHGGKLLKNKGKYYEYKRSFVGYDQILRKFKKCTLCHVSEPGTMELTRTGMELKKREVTMDHLGAPDRPDRTPEKTKAD